MMSYEPPNYASALAFLLSRYTHAEAAIEIRRVSSDVGYAYLGDAKPVTPKMESIRHGVSVLGDAFDVFEVYLIDYGHAGARTETRIGAIFWYEGGATTYAFIGP